MSLGKRTAPDESRYAECSAPGAARALALVDDFGHLFTVLGEWRQVYGEELTAWAVQVQAGGIEHLPAELVDGWEEIGDLVRLDTERRGYVTVSDYRDVPVRPDITARRPSGLRAAPPPRT
ncbi:hypothetical protein STRCI_008619 [Streptomyces cinnabarinus]|uniref:Uncharacterized protein n=1 Tax=Streptomyces cinnabarinus TaxID=67287 RepID=A0ABY7KRF5_9ACTN|nr:hypothetical protein [Streptomyces cinnabarinus]WAZ26934.1 hypothetical protein STRCI_008619 [Streptomyces cinnabarinus]